MKSQIIDESLKLYLIREGKEFTREVYSKEELNIGDEVAYIKMVTALINHHTIVKKLTDNCISIGKVIRKGDAKDTEIAALQARVQELEKIIERTEKGEE